MKNNGFRYSKAMGQCFLIDGNIPEKIVRLSGIGGSDRVLEVGPGAGALTLALSRAAERVTAVELDVRLLPALRDALAGTDNVDVIQGDILKLDIRKLAEEKMPGRSRHVCANLPYNITSPAIAALVESRVFETITVMVQREVAKRICAEPGDPDYGAFSVFARYHTEPEILFYVPPECFYPRPSVHSAVVKMSVRKDALLGPAEEAMFFRVVRAAFGQRRKTLVNALCAAFGGSAAKAGIAEAVRACGFDERARGEELGVDGFIALSSEIGSEIR